MHPLRTHLGKKLTLFAIFIALGVMGVQMLRQQDPEAYHPHPLPPMDCVSYDPFFHFFHFDYRDYSQRVKPEWVRSDLQMLTSYTHCIRIYTTMFGMDIVPKIAAEYHMQVIAGAEINDDPDITKEDMSRLITLAHENPNISHVIAGNEALLQTWSKTRKNAVTPKQLYAQIDYVRKRVKQPVSTGEPFVVWYWHPDMAKHVDFVAAHVFPYWEGIRDENMSTWTMKVYNTLQSLFPGKQILLAEVGEPTSGSAVRNAIPNKWAAYDFLKMLQRESKIEHFSYVVIEAFDQPWKQQFHEGQVGAHWGVFRINGKSKFDTDMVSFGVFSLTYEELATLILAGLFLLLWTDFAAAFSLWMGVVAPLMAFVLAYVAVCVASAMIEEYVYLNVLASCVLIPAGIILLINLIYKLHITLDVMGQRPLHRRFERHKGARTDQPFISVHIPCRNEQPDHVIACISSVLNQRYEHFEIIVVDNNTTDKKLWQPVEEFCRRHAQKVQFFHVEKLQGFKAGALSFALSHTAEQASVIGVLDADYMVEPDWLYDCSRYLTGKIAAVQAPQDYVEDLPFLFLRSIYDEYRGFFQIGMIQRNERNAIVQQGTMVLIEKNALTAAGGWHTDSIVEDTDLGVRLLMGGYECIYVNRSYGKGRLPTRFAEYRKQRFRWAYGATRILIKYAGAFFFNRGGKLTLKQRMDFILGWLPWIGNIFHPILVVVATILSFYCIKSDRYVLTGVLFLPILFYVLVDSVCNCLTYRKRLKLSAERTLFSLLAGLSLVWTIAHGVFTAIFYRHYPFKVTRKAQQDKRRIRDALRMPSVAIPLLSSFCLLGFAEFFSYDFFTITPDLRLWVLLLMVVAAPGLATGLMVMSEKFPLTVKETHKKRGRLTLSSDARSFIGFILTSALLTAAAIGLTLYLLGPTRSSTFFFDEAYSALNPPYYDPIINHQGDLVVTFFTALFLVFVTGSRFAGAACFVMLYLANLAKIYILREYIIHNDLVHIRDLWIGVDWGARAALLALIAALAVILYRYFNWRIIKVRLCICLALIVLTMYGFAVPGDTLNELWEDGFIHQVDQDPYGMVLHNGPVMAILVHELHFRQLMRALKDDTMAPDVHPKDDFRTVPARAILDKPNIYILMLESYLDPYYFHNLRFNIPPVQGLLALETAGHDTSAFYTIRSTAAAEFEVLCGMPNQQGYTSKVFNQLLAPADSLSCLPSYLKRLGYITIASHPNTPSIYNRGNAYPLLGFDRVYFATDLDMQDKDSIWLNDNAFLSQNLQMVKKQLATHTPFLNYVMTVGGHFPYELNARRPAMLKTDPAIPSLALKSLQLSYYTSDAVSHYLEALRKLDPGALIVIMGDHFPYVINSDDALVAWQAKQAHDAPSFTPVHPLYNLDHQTFGMMEYKNRFLPQEHFEQFEVADMLVDIMTRGHWCSIHHCLYRQPYMLLADDVVYRSNPAKRYCDQEGETSKDIHHSVNGSPARQRECAQARHWQQDYLLLYRHMLRPFFN